MINYVIKRFLYAIPILIGVNLLTFTLFFVVNSPEEVARLHLGNKRVTQEQIISWNEQRGYNYPLFINQSEQGINVIKKTIFYEKSLKLFYFEFGISDSGRDIKYDIKQRMWPSLAIALPSLLVGLMLNITFALFFVFFRSTRVDYIGVIICVALMSISSLFYIIGGQYLISKLLQLVPISGYSQGYEAIKFLVLPVLISVIYGIGSGTRWYRSLFLEEIEKDYVKTAKSKGLSEASVLFKHVFKNALIPILTGVVVILPLLFLGSLIVESFFILKSLSISTTSPFLTTSAFIFFASKTLLCPSRCLISPCIGNTSDGLIFS